VVFTTRAGTHAALQRGRALSRELHADVTLLVAQIVPFPLPLDRPPVAETITEKVWSEFAGHLDSEISVRVFLCRDRAEMLREQLAAGSIVLIGTRQRSWLPAAERSLAKRLERDGHQVILVDARTEMLDTGLKQRR
jgi:hypothetical protein